MIPETGIAVDRLAYAVLRVADEVEDLRATVHDLTLELAAERAANAPLRTEYELLLKARREEGLASVNLRTKAYNALAQPAVIAAIISALLAGLGIASTGERLAAAASAFAAGDSTTIEVHNATP